MINLSSFALSFSYLRTYILGCTTSRHHIGERGSYKWRCTDPDWLDIFPVPCPPSSRPGRHRKYFFEICHGNFGYSLGGSWGKFFMSDWSLTGPFWSLIAPESCSKVSLSIFYCRKVLQPIKDLCYKISLSDNIFMISKLDPAMFFFILLDSSKIKTSKKLILLTQLSVAWKWSLS